MHAFRPDEGGVEKLTSRIETLEFLLLEAAGLRAEAELTRIRLRAMCEALKRERTREHRPPPRAGYSEQSSTSAEAPKHSPVRRVK
jgi:hypothetical protein